MWTEDIVHEGRVTEVKDRETKSDMEAVVLSMGKNRVLKAKAAIIRHPPAGTNRV